MKVSASASIVRLVSFSVAPCVAQAAAVRVQYSAHGPHPSGWDPPPPEPRSTAKVVVGAGAVVDGSGIGAAATVEAPKTRHRAVARSVRAEANMVVMVGVGVGVGAGVGVSCWVRARFYNACRSGDTREAGEWRDVRVGGWVGEEVR